MKFAPYESPVAFLARKFKVIALLRSLYFQINIFDTPLSSFTAASEGKSSLFLGGFNPILAMKKDLVDTFKPYKAGFYLLRDILQPVRGVGNGVKGVFYLGAAPVIFTINTVRYTWWAIKESSLHAFTMNMNLNILKTAGGIADGFSNITRGVTQIVATPLTWFLKIPLRVVITLVKGQPTVAQEVEQRVEALEAQIKKKEKTLEDTQAIDSEMYSISKKLIKSMDRGQEPGVDMEKAASKFAQCKKFTEKKESYYYETSYRPDNSEHTQTRALNFLGLFKPDAPETPDVSPILSAWDNISGNSYI